MNDAPPRTCVGLLALLAPVLLLVGGCAASPGAGGQTMLVVAEAPLPEGARFDPVVMDVEGWTVHVEPVLLEAGEHADVGERALTMLANHLQRIAILLPEDRLTEVRKLEIWIEHRHPELGAMQYHPSERWLAGKGYDPRLAKKYHIPRAASLYSRGQLLKHPAVVLHELAHAYHDQVLGFDDPRVIDAYKNAMDQGLYDKVMLYTGREVRAYAATNHKEFFSEATEAYFYRNDFYPFVAAELKQHDPHTYKLMQEIWGPLR
ncbi:MAG: metallopeptidase [Phycisphaeraceae bacterium]